MKQSREQLYSVLKTAQMGQIGIRSVLDTGMAPTLRQALETQLREYDTIESEAYTIASQHGWELPEVDPAVRFFSDRLSRMKLTRGNCDSKIADMVIRTNMNGMIRGLKNMHRYPIQDDWISSISQKLLDCETANIHNMQTFL